MANEINLGPTSPAVDFAVNQFVLERFRREHTGHLAECPDITVAEYEAYDGAYGCDTRCEYLRLEATVTCPHTETPTEFTYGEFGDIAGFIEELEHDYPQKEQT